MKLFHQNMIKNKWKERDVEFFLFLLYFLFMAIYYGGRLFCLTPWYDELYTYYCFISKGPVYAGIHWPLPNNHLGYSVLSGFLSYLGNGYIALRGVAYMASLANLCLLFSLGRKCLHKGMSFILVILFSMAALVNTIAIQGRGYSLATLFFLLSLWAIWKILYEQEQIKWYVLWIVSLTGGLYTIPSSLYWVISVCFIGGCVLLIERKYRTLWRLIAASLIAACATGVLYGLLWLAIGSNLLVKTADSLYYGLGHFQVILKHPLTAVWTGIQYMLNQPYIQSVPREGYFPKLINYMGSIWEQFYGSMGIWLLLLSFLAVIVANFIAYRRKQWFLAMLLNGTLLLTPFVLFVQAKLPYFRVFSYFAIPVAFSLIYLLQEFLEQLNIRNKVILILSMLLTIIAIGSLKTQFVQYGSWEHAIEEAYLSVDPRQYENICVADCNSQYLLKLHYGIECENTSVTDSDYVILHKNMMDPNYEEFVWEYYLNYDTIDWNYVNTYMTIAYENDLVVLFTTNK